MSFLRKRGRWKSLHSERKNCRMDRMSGKNLYQKPVRRFPVPVPHLHLSHFHRFPMIHRALLCLDCRKKTER